MGLDMSLYRMKQVDAEKDFANVKKEEVIYWRKANQRYRSPVLYRLVVIL